jgi:hypothetical protein
LAVYKYVRTAYPEHVFTGTKFRLLGTAEARQADPFKKFLRKNKTKEYLPESLEEN